MSRFIHVVGCHGQRNECLPKALAILANVTPNPKSDLVPWFDDDAIERAASGAGVSKSELIGRHGETRQSGGPSSPEQLSRGRLQRIGNTIGDNRLTDLATSDVFWDEVVEIVPLGEMPTFDATVENTHNFISQGIIAHNSLEQDADVVMFLYRDEVYNSESPDRGSAELIISKHRNGPTGVTHLAFLDHYTRFANMARV